MVLEYLQIQSKAEIEASDQIPHPVVIKCSAPGKTKFIKFPPSRAGKDVKCPGGCLSFDLTGILHYLLLPIQNAYSRLTLPGAYYNT